MLAVGGSGQVLEEESQRLCQILNGFFFRRSVTSHLGIEATRDKNAIFLDYFVGRDRFAVHSCHVNKFFADFNENGYAQLVGDAAYANGRKTEVYYKSRR